MDLTFITGNPAKAEILSRLLDYPVSHRKLELVEIQSMDLSEVVASKAREAYRVVQAPVLIEDSTLVFEGMGRLPGTFIKWFEAELGLEGLCRLADGSANRAATGQVLYGLFDGTTLETFYGEARGHIAEHPRGQNGYGWDPIFIPAGYTRTRGEMTQQEQQESSMRKAALAKLQAFLVSAA
ncbi:MAG TPA: non-canonical purine NTP pyrophosphatase [Myxococcaceae bacterium]|nr:non-canonical purine NTP pyrophosphatase [Myxococcaceae bacterium]